MDQNPFQKPPRDLGADDAILDGIAHRLGRRFELTDCANLPQRLASLIADLHAQERGSSSDEDGA